MKIYFACGWFDKQQSNHEEILFKHIKEYFNDTFRPRTDNNINKSLFNDFNERQNGFNNNIKQIKKADIIIANITSRDSGTLFEVGFAYALKKPILLFDWLLNNKKPNLMLAFAGKLGLATDLTKFVHKLQYLSKLKVRKVKKINDIYKGNVE